MEQDGNKASIIRAITSPLGFFALSLLIVEGFLTIVLIFSDLDPGQKYMGMWIGATLFGIVVLGVWILVIWKPKNLTFGEGSHIKESEMKIWGTNESATSQKIIEQERPIGRRTSSASD